MSDTDEPQNRTYHQPDPDAVEVRDSEGEDGLFDIRLPVVTTGEVRNEGDESFSREEIEGMAQQINEGSITTFLDHGANPDAAGSRYSATEKVGVWRDAEVETRDADGEDQVVATAALMDPETLPGETGAIREMLARVKAQIERGIPQATSIGWKEDEDAPGGHDLWEMSIVGIPADPRTTEDDVAVAAARGVLADADLEPEKRERLAEEFRAVVMGSDTAQTFRDLTEQQTEMALDLLERFVEEQGNASVRNFEGWLWEVDDDGSDVDENAIHAAHTALEDFYRAHSPMDDPVDDTFRDWLEGQTDEEGSNVTNNSNNSADDADDEDRDGSDGISADEFREQMLEMQRNQTETLDALVESNREDDDGDEGEEEDDEEENEGDGEDEEDDEEQSASAQTVEIDGEERDVGDLVEDHQTALEELRANGVKSDDLDIPEADAEQDAEGEDGEERDADADSTDSEPSFSFTEDNE